ncbi:MAG: glutamine synthetase III [Planctomycetes bacterium]|nr:glutamine synthetase III [Planctomycetota bacterium]
MTADANPNDLFSTFGADVFGPAAMKRHCSFKVCAAMDAAAHEGQPIDRAVIDEFANGLKLWALSKGATHFTHWFQPLTGAVAEKHDAFLAPDMAGGVLAQFSGKDLVQGEPDASSFPSGGLRATFEARGYTTWDPNSPAFVANAGTSRAVLCIPSLFCGYRGEALDLKTPLLRSQAALAKQLERVGRLFDIPRKTRPYATLGSEQEYFLIDRRDFNRRPDLVMCGRTLFGRRPARHQQLEDHYFGRIKPRILEFMAEVDSALWRLGVPVKTRHNEVSPAQFELAPVFEEQNLAVDNNLLIMQTLQDVACRRGFACLLHEKPFAGVNGSGKHNNWSITGTDGRNWFAPGDTPHENAKFLFMLAAVIQAIDEQALLLRASVATAGNDHRLGANEAPPAIMSVYLGEQLSDIIDQIANGGARTSKVGETLSLGVSRLPPLPRDVSDRNRTSPFAFTGNKFEFRAVGSSQSCAEPNTVLNLAIAQALDDLCGKMDERLAGASLERGADGHSREFHKALQEVLQASVRAHRRVLFDGDGYSAEWRAEAARRGLPCRGTSPEALAAMVEPAALELFSRYEVLNEREMRARHDVHQHAWEQVVQMEGGCALDLARTFILPAALELERRLAASLDLGERFNRKDPARRQAFDRAAGLVEALHHAMEALAAVLDSGAEGGQVNQKQVELREVVDQLEAFSPDGIWPFPCYGEMFFRQCEE